MRVSHEIAWEILILKMNLMRSAVIPPVEPAGKVSFVYNCTQAKLMVNAMEND